MASEASSEPIIRVESLVAGYGDRTIFDGVSFEVARGEVFVILGSSGSDAVASGCGIAAAGGALPGDITNEGSITEMTAETTRALKTHVHRCRPGLGCLLRRFGGAPKFSWTRPRSSRALVSSMPAIKTHN